MDGGGMSNYPPEVFMDRMRNELGEEWPAFRQAYELPAVRGIRFRPEIPDLLQNDRAKMERIPWESNGFYTDTEAEWGKTILHEAGAFYLQEPSAMIPAAVFNAQPGETLLDLCAAPGGKSTQVGAAMTGKGVLVCNEIVPKRAQILSRNIERMGIRNAIVTQEFPERLAGKWPEGFDGVLVDAPCSGEGMFRRDPETIGEWSTEKARGCAERQREILEQAAKLVRPGGRLVYSTCTFHPDENEGNVCWFLDRFPEFEPEPFDFCGETIREGYRTFYPHRIRGEGQFAARFRKRGTGTAELGSASLPPVGKEERKMLRELFSDTLPEENIRAWGTRLIQMDALPDLSGIRVLRCGLHIAEKREKYLLPDHALALSGATHTEAEDLDAELAAKYIAGETVPSNQNGWVAARYRGMNLGWGKAGQGTMKNHYPKGLRKLHLLP